MEIIRKEASKKRIHTNNYSILCGGNIEIYIIIEPIIDLKRRYIEKPDNVANWWQ